MSRLLEAIEAHARFTPAALAVTGTDAALSYAALPGEVARVAGALSARLDGVRPDAPVAVALDNGPAAVVVDLALIRLGRPSLPLPPFFTRDQAQYALADCGAALLLRGVGEGGGDLTAAGQALEAAPLPFPAVALPPGTAKITYTSGSTSEPKGVCLSLEQMEALAAALVEVLGREHAGVHLPVLPLAVLLENVAGLYASLLAGGRYHAPGLAGIGFAQAFRPDFARMVEVVRDDGATSVILTPELLRGLIAALSASGGRLDRLTLVAVGGAKVAPSLVAGARALGLPVYEGYGLSECASVVALNTPAAERLGTVGKPLPHLEVSLAADGEILVGPNPFLGYVRGPAQSGPVRTGDLGAFDDDGFLRVTGRRTNTIITAFGRNIAPEWVESELLAQPEIGQALVFGEAQPALGALVVPSHPAFAETAIRLAVERANARLPDYAQVGRWRVTPPFDRAAGQLTANGRPRREALLAAHRSFVDSPS